MKGLCRIKTEPTQNRQAKISARENLTWIREKGKHFDLKKEEAIKTREKRNEHRMGKRNF